MPEHLEQALALGLIAAGSPGPKTQALLLLAGEETIPAPAAPAVLLPQLHLTRGLTWLSLLLPPVLYLLWKKRFNKLRKRFMAELVLNVAQWCETETPGWATQAWGCGGRAKQTEVALIVRRYSNEISKARSPEKDPNTASSFPASSPTLKVPMLGVFKKRRARCQIWLKGWKAIWESAAL